MTSQWARWRLKSPAPRLFTQPFIQQFKRISKKTSKLRVTGPCEGNSPVSGEFPAQRASNAENVSIWWHHHRTGPFVLAAQCQSSQTDTANTQITGHSLSHELNTECMSHLFKKHKTWNPIIRTTIILVLYISKIFLIVPNLSEITRYIRKKKNSGQTSVKTIFRRHFVPNEISAYPNSSLLLYIIWLSMYGFEVLLFTEINTKIQVTGICQTHLCTTHGGDILKNDSKKEMDVLDGWCFARFQLNNTLRPRQNGRHFPDDLFKCIFLNENVWISIKISLKFVPKCPIDNIPALVQIMAWRRIGDKPLSEPMIVRLPTHICVTRTQWVEYVSDQYPILQKNPWYLPRVFVGSPSIDILR